MCKVCSLNLTEAICGLYCWAKETTQPGLGVQNNLAKLNLDEPNIAWIFGLPIVSLENQLQMDSDRKFISNSLLVEIPLLCLWKGSCNAWPT